ncbi:MrcB family domain-containing protein [Methanobacterium formicicum]|uniref:DUF3578 domain-containing protein n=1 Tax=Methanobacterium formicicum TaxID=2162 RepID=A0A843AJY1_METFO|nr:DUF3578 domain-containing protein [Methanobacterium formicicum]MBF4475942.1 DUF3578 domain-containing protein [Methanobacterium formicicum]
MLKQFMEKIFNDYQSAKKEKYVDNKLAKLIKKDFPNNLKDLTKDIGDYKIIGYSGEGKWAESPYIAIFNSEISEGLESGYYILYIFSENTEKVYLTLNQDIGNQNNLNRDELEFKLINQANNIQKNLKIPETFNTNKLSGLGPNYRYKRLEVGNIFSKNYYSDNLPSEEELESDLIEMLNLYNELISKLPKVWQISPGSVKSGEQDKLWPLYKDEGFIGIGWLHDSQSYLDFKNIDELKDALTKFYSNYSDTDPSQAARMVWDFTHKIKKGDIVVANAGLRKSLGIGIVKSNYISPNNAENPGIFDYFWHLRRIEWLITDDVDFNQQLFYRQTLAELNEDRWNRIKNVYINKNPDYSILFEQMDDLIDQLVRPQVDIRTHLEFIFNNLPVAKSRNQRVKGHEVGKAFSEISRGLGDIVKSIDPEDEFKTQAYFQDRGRWYRKPYIYVENTANKNIHGQWDQHFVGLWFNDDLDGLEISLQQGADYARNLLDNKLSEYTDEDLEKYIQHHVEDVRHQIKTSHLSGKLDGFDENFGNLIIYGKKYDKNDLPSNDQIISDFKELFKMYLLLKPDEDGGITTETTFFDDLTKQGYFFDYRLIENFLLSLKVKPFVILTGNSGTGKTKIAQLFAKYLEKNNKIKTIVKKATSEEYNTKKEANDVLSTINDSLETYPNDQVRDLLPNLIEAIDDSKDFSEPGTYEIIPVGANWTENRHILGFYNVITSEYDFTKSLKLILNAMNNKDSPYFLILDEMNLSHVERYFSDFLSAIESNEDLELHSNDDLKEPPSKIKLTSNLMVIGTVNIDETTYMFSPKVLDRANTLEFLTQPAVNYMSKTPEYNINGDMEYLLNPLSDLDLRMDDINKIKDKLINVRTHDNEFIWDKLTFYLNEFQNTLKKADFDFGFRTINEVTRFMIVAWKYEGQNTVWDNWERYFDAQILQKMLPKIHGSQRELDSVLKELRQLCNEKNSDNIIFPNSAEKLDKMIKRLSEKRYVAFTG